MPQAGSLTLTLTGISVSACQRPPPEWVQHADSWVSPPENVIPEVWVCIGICRISKYPEPDSGVRGLWTTLYERLLNLDVVRPALPCSLRPWSSGSERETSQTWSGFWSIGSPEVFRLLSALSSCLGAPGNPGLHPYSCTAWEVGASAEQRGWLWAASGSWPSSVGRVFTSPWTRRCSDALPPSLDAL